MPGPTTEETAGTAATVATAAGTVNLDVSLDTSEDPPVKISTRSKEVDIGKTIKWKKKGGSLGFKFTNFVDHTPLPPKGPAFKSLDIEDSKITCTFDPPTKKKGDPERIYPYTITVRYNEKDYTSDETGVSKTEPVVLRTIIGAAR